jgi:hypothetical protein
MKIIGLGRGVKMVGDAETGNETGYASVSVLD